MEPIAVTVRGEYRWMLIHRCTHCGRLRMNRTAADDSVLLLVQLAALPLATPPVPYVGAQASALHIVNTADRRADEGRPAASARVGGGGGGVCSSPSHVQPSDWGDGRNVRNHS